MTTGLRPVRARRSEAPAKKESWYTPNFEIKNGVIALPTGPGLGLQFDPEFVKKAKVVTV